MISKRLYKIPTLNHQFLRYSSLTLPTIKKLNDIEYQKISDAYLEDLTDYFEDLGETLELSPSFHIDSYDVLYSSGVLTLQLGPSLGSFVINKQPPNKQIWLSSPISGPKRYDYTTDNQWRYVRDASRLKDLLDSELSKLLKINVQVP